MLIILNNLFGTFQGQDNLRIVFLSFTVSNYVLDLYTCSTLGSSTNIQNYSRTFLEHFKNKHVITRWMMGKYGYQNWVDYEIKKDGKIRS